MTRSSTMPLTRATAGADAAPAGGGGLPRRRLVLGALTTVLFLAFGIWLVAFSSVFGVGKVVVKGNHLLTAAQVRATAHIRDGAPLIRLNTAAIARRVETLPDIASAAVSLDYPSTVVITVHERVPVGFVAGGSGYRLIDRTGLQYRAVTSTPTDLPRFVLPSGVVARSTGAAVATVAADLPRTLLRKIASIQALDPTAITLVLDDGRIVRWGSGQRSADKARILPVLLLHKGRVFDLTNPDQPFVRI